MKLTQSRMFPRWRTPAPKPFTPEGITPGAEVRFSGLTQQGERRRGVGQVWAKSERGMWWVVTPEGVAVECLSLALTVLSQCDEQLSIEGVA